VASLSQGRTAAAQCGLFTYKSVPVIFEPPCISPNIIKTECALMCLIMPLTSAYSEPGKSDLLKIITLLVFHPCLGLPIIIFRSGI